MTGRVHVVGSANVDRTIPVPAVPGPGETVLGGAAGRGPGGKGLNQAVAAARLGAMTAFVGAVGRDEDGDRLLAALEGEGIDIGAVAQVTEPTGLAMILLEPDGSNRIVVAPGANDRVTGEGLDCGPGDVVVAQLEIPVVTVADTLRAARRVDARTVLNAAPARPDVRPLIDLVDVLVVNEPELAALAPVDPDRDDLDALASATRQLEARLGAVVTLGPRGALLVTGEDQRHLAAPSVPVEDTTGAGDCFVGALAAGLTGRGALRSACEFAVRAASWSVTVAGAAPSMPTAGALAAWATEAPPRSR